MMDRFYMGRVGLVLGHAEKEASLVYPDAVVQEAVRSGLIWSLEPDLKNSYSNRAQEYPLCSLVSLP